MRSLHRATIVLCVPFLFAAVALTNCGDDNNLQVNGGGGAGGFGGAHGTGGSGGTGTGGADAAVTDAPAVADVINIQSMTFSPVVLKAAAGATVMVNNLDTLPHTVTSQSAPGQYVPGAVQGISFDTGTIAPGGMATFTIPASAVPGTIIPYYCKIHTSTMANALLNSIAVQ